MFWIMHGTSMQARTLHRRYYPGSGEWRVCRRLRLFTWVFDKTNVQAEGERDSPKHRKRHEETLRQNSPHAFFR